MRKVKAAGAQGFFHEWATETARNEISGDEYDHAVTVGIVEIDGKINTFDPVEIEFLEQSQPDNPIIPATYWQTRIRESEAKIVELETHNTNLCGAADVTTDELNELIAELEQMRGLVRWFVGRELFNEDKTAGAIRLRFSSDADAIISAVGADWLDEGGNNGNI